MLGALGLLVAPASGGSQEGARLAAVRVSIEVRPAEARVVALYRLAGAGGPAAFRAFRVPGQDVALAAAAGEDPARAPPSAVETLPGMFRWAPRPPAGSGNEVRLAYVVTGRVDRVPLFVPDVPAVPGESSIEIRIRGLPAGTPGGGSFPRLTRVPGGDLVARPDNLPAFVWLPSPLGRGLERVAEAGALLLVLGGTAAWWILRGRSRGRRAESGGARVGRGAGSGAANRGADGGP